MVCKGNTRINLTLLSTYASKHKDASLFIFLREFSYFAEINVF